MKKKTVEKKGNMMTVKAVVKVRGNCPYRMGMPSGCAACGNPAYPACKNSCPMFDN